MFSLVVSSLPSTSTDNRGVRPTFASLCNVMQVIFIIPRLSGYLDRENIENKNEEQIFLQEIELTEVK